MRSTSPNRRRSHREPQRTVATGPIRIRPVLSAIACYQQLAIGVHFRHVAIGRDSKICVGLWSLPNYTAVVVLIALVFVEPSLPLHVQRTVEGAWMFAALFLPISTIFAMAKAVHLSLRAGDKAEVRIWQSVVAWCLVAVAVAFNVFSYVVLAPLN